MGFQQGLSGLSAAASSLDVIGNNIANSTTAGFKSSTAQFADVYATSLSGSGTNPIGTGVQLAGVAANFLQGNIAVTSNPLDAAIDGIGFFRLDTNGVISYTRNGQFHIDKYGELVNAANAKVTGYTAVDGAIVPGNLGPLAIPTDDLLPKTSSKAGIVANLDSRAAIPTVSPFDPADAGSYNSATSINVYDSLGNAHAFATYYAKTADNTWSVYGTVDGVAQAAVLGTLAFSTGGTLTGPVVSPGPPPVYGLASVTLTLPVVAGANPTVTLAPVNFTGTTQFASSFGVTALTQDGYSSGKFTAFSIAGDGTMQGRYSNGETRPLGQVVLATFANSEGLQPLGGNAFAESSTSGQALVGAPGSSSLGSLQSGAVEESNVDLTRELVGMITAQRFYQANAQTVKTQDQVLNTLVNLR